MYHIVLRLIYLNPANHQEAIKALNIVLGIIATSVQISFALPGPLS